ncbi:MAG: AI-2E family transporter YdiK [Rhizobiales bacterium]|nr:AI-2E family transporter YdiK [Hyphomicrobiales bacterium]
MTDIKRDLTRTTLALLFLGALIVTSFYILKPFLPAIVWAMMIVIATWPAFLGMQRHLWGSRLLATIVMTALLLLILILPLSFAAVSIVSNADEIATWARWMMSFELPPAPRWLTDLPMIGEPIGQGWAKLTSLGIRDLWAQAAPYAFDATKWLIGQAGGVGSMIMHFVITVIAASILYADGERAAALLRRFGRRLAGDRGENSVLLASQAIRSVALGVIVTALIQAALGGIGLAIAGIPFAPLLIAIMFALAIAQIGVWPVMFGAVIWMFWMGDTAWATFLLIWSIPVVIIDNFIRPFLIKRGADLPIILIFIGVIGGLLGFGLVGIFVGPVVLSVAYTLLNAWMAEDPEGTDGRVP